MLQRNSDISRLRQASGAAAVPDLLCARTLMRLALALSFLGLCMSGMSQNMLGRQQTYFGVSTRVYCIRQYVWKSNKEQIAKILAMSIASPKP